jgi:hypothetical protein
MTNRMLPTTENRKWKNLSKTEKKQIKEIIPFIHKKNRDEWLRVFDTKPLTQVMAMVRSMQAETDYINEGVTVKEVNDADLLKLDELIQKVEKKFGVRLIVESVDEARYTDTKPNPFFRNAHGN